MKLSKKIVLNGCGGIHCHFQIQCDISLYFDRLHDQILKKKIGVDEVGVDKQISLMVNAGDGGLEKSRAFLNFNPFLLVTR